MEEQIKELTLLLLYLTSWTEKEPYGEYQRAWKGYDFDILNKLQSENMIGGSTYKAKSTYGVRIDIWTHLMRGCIINYVH